ncbi:matrixin family metalloprotease [Nocardioides sp.]|uniref:matrixin family metalloprotease n=1 Tax=Nocardioides sp. TaxID=35761 RepID=UPI003D12ED5D
MHLEPLAPPPPRTPLSRRSWLSIIGVLGLLAAALVAMAADSHDPLDRLLGGTEMTGKRDEYRFLHTHPRGGTLPIGYDPCTPIVVTVDPDGAPDDYRDLVETAMEHTSSASGLSFDYAGPTSERNFSERDSSDPVLVLWADADEVPELAGDVAGIGGSSMLTGTGRPYYVTGSIVLDRDNFEAGTSAASRQAILDHEFGHLVGLDHVNRIGELMNPSPRVTTYGRGDLRGLALLGQVPCS